MVRLVAAGRVPPQRVDGYSRGESPRGTLGPDVSADVIEEARRDSGGGPNVYFSFATTTLPTLTIARQTSCTARPSSTCEPPDRLRP
jgi:hypothetical protein